MLGLALFPLVAVADGLLAVDNPAMNGTEIGGYVRIEAFEADGLAGTGPYDRDRQGPYSPPGGTTLSLVAARAETGAQLNGYRVGLLYRAEALLETNRDTFDLVSQYKNAKELDARRTYQIDYRIKGFEAVGARIAKSFHTEPIGDWHVDWGLGVSWLRGLRARVETASGQVATINAKDFNANATLDSMDSKVDISGGGKFNPPFGAHPTLSGQGGAIDLGVVVQRLDGLRLAISVNDLYGRMAWKNLPDYAAKYNTDTKYYDANGYVHFNPLLKAQSCYRDFTQTLDPKFRLAFVYPLGAFEVQASSSYTRGYWFPEVGVAYRFTPQWAMNADYDIRFRTVSISIRHQWLYFGANGSHNLGKPSGGIFSGSGDALASTTPIGPVAGSSPRCGLI